MQKNVTELLATANHRDPLFAHLLPAKQNKRFRGVINSFLNEYTAAPGKSEKSKIVTKALNIVRKASPEGAFVKLEKGKWHEVSLRYAREKVKLLLLAAGLIRLRLRVARSLVRSLPNQPMVCCACAF